MVELLGNMGPAHSVETAKSRETEQERVRRAISVNDKVKSLIGTFPAFTVEGAVGMTARI